MIQSLTLSLTPDEIDSESALERAIRLTLHLDEGIALSWRITHRSIDARSKMPRFILKCSVAIGEPLPLPESNMWRLTPKRLTKTVAVVGAGPAGYFAALKLLDLGIRPIVLEQGRDVVRRRLDIAALLKRGVVHPDSNYGFGEGGAGAYSDGKLYTRSNKRGDVGEILRILVAHGASDDILVDAHPHIGSNRLPRIVRAMRNTILEHGGEVRFEAKVTDLILRDGRIRGVIVHSAEAIPSDAVILATGHSARETYRMLDACGMMIEPKGFALGVRIEHPQPRIDSIRYHHSPRHPKLPAATYTAKTQVADRGVFSFCMCPGGFIVPASTAPNELVLNGMSLSSRASAFANAGIVVEVRPEDVHAAGFGTTALAGIDYQQAIEHTCFDAGGKGLQAPAQRLTDFVEGRFSNQLPETSYLPGTTSCRLDHLLPEPIAARLQQAFRVFGKTMRGYYTQEAVVLACESRTSSPVRIPRKADTLMHVQIENLYPCGEGAGYSGGIVSSAIDGQNVAKRVAQHLNA